ncbi:MAG: calcium/sodium antiporter [Verrucomicrobiales bacterium]
MDWLLNISALILGLVALYFGAEWLVGGSSRLALRFGLSPLVVGLTVVAFGTSAPEMFVSIGFNMNGLPDASVGNIVGSNICNIALILGLSALIRPLDIKGQIIKREMPILIIASMALIAMLWDGKLAQWEGGLLTCGIIVYVVTSLRLAKTAGSELLDEFENEFGDEESASGGGKPLVFTLLIIAGLLTLVLGSHLLQVGAVFIAKGFGVSEAIIGLTLLAFGTSLPELATSIVACMKNEGDIVAGNAVGSSIFNIFAVLGVTAAIKEMKITAIEPVDLGVMMAAAVLVVPMMATRRRLARSEGLILVVCYLAYVASLAMRG